MSNPYIGEIRIFAGNFAPANWALCQGQTLSIANNEALFALIGTTYGGNGITTFQLPNLQGSFPVHMGGSNSYVIGQTGGASTVTLTSAQLPSHTHTLQAQTVVGASTLPTAANFAASSEGQYAPASGASGSLNAAAVATAGGSQSHDNMIPYVAITYIIALYGVFPSRN